MGADSQGMDLLTVFNQYIAPWVRARFGRSERGASLVEYALLVALIAVVCIVAITFVGSRANDKFSSVGSSIGG
jgi:pilus assembly protein Flp/PilA